MSAFAEASTESQRRLQQLAHGVRDRGAMLPKGWRCEVIPRKCQLPVRGQDVTFSSPEGDSFRSTLDVYKHLRLNVHLPKGSKKRKEHPEADGLHDTSVTSGAIKLVSETAVSDLPRCLQEVPIMCNRKQGIWYLADNKVECSDTGCVICHGRPLADRFMARSGPKGFGKHAGLSEAIWRTSFRVDLPGYEDMSVLNYFNFHGYSLAYVRKSPKKAERVVHWDRNLNADRVVQVLNADRAKGPPTPAQQAQLQPTQSQLTQTEHKPQALDTTGGPSQHQSAGCPLNNEEDIVMLQQQLASVRQDFEQQMKQLDGVRQDFARQTKQLDGVRQDFARQTKQVEGLTLASQHKDQLIAHHLKVADGRKAAGSGSEDIEAMCAAHKREKAALQTTHEQEKAAIQAAHEREVAAFRAQAAQAKAEYMQVLGEKQKLQDVIYDLKVGGAAHQGQSRQS